MASPRGKFGPETRYGSRRARSTGTVHPPIAPCGIWRSRKRWTASTLLGSSRYPMSNTRRMLRLECGSARHMILDQCPTMPRPKRVKSVPKDPGSSSCRWSSVGLSVWRWCKQPDPTGTSPVTTSAKTYTTPGDTIPVLATASDVVILL